MLKNVKKLDNKVIFCNFAEQFKRNSMKRVRDLNGKCLTKFDMVYLMLVADHQQTKHDYWYYDTLYNSVGCYTYAEIANVYLNEFLI